MKLFGGGTPQHPRRSNQEAEPAAHRPPAQHQPAPRAAYNGPTAPKPEDIRQPPSKRQKRNRVLIIIVAVTLAIIAGMCAAAAVMMRPPTIDPPASTSTNEPVKPPRKNDTIVKDEEEEPELDEGDAPDVDMGNRREGVYTVLVAATDQDETRTDALMVATLDTVNDTVNVINIPRDLMSNCNRSGDAKKINAAYGTKKGIETTKSEVKKVLGFTPDQYVVINFNGIADIIDALGGVTYDVPWRMKYDDPTQDLHIDFQPGETKMDGKAAVEFMRWRKNNSGVSTGVKGTTGGDEERIEKDQEFLKFLAKQVFTVGNVPRIPALAQAVFKNVKTDLTAGEVLWLAWQLYDVKNENINMMTLPGYGTMSYAGTGTMYSFFFPYRSQVLEMVNEFINPYEKPITNIDVVSGPSKGSGKSSSKKTSKPKEEEKDPDETDSSETTGGEENSTSGSSGTSGSSSNGSGDRSGSTSGNSNSDGSSNSGSGSNSSGNSNTGSDSKTDGARETQNSVSSGEDTSSGGDGSGESGSGVDAPAEDGTSSGTDGSGSTSAPEPGFESTSPAEQVFPENMFGPSAAAEPAPAPESSAES